MTPNTDLLCLLVFTFATITSSVSPNVVIKTIDGFPSLSLHNFGRYQKPGQIPDKDFKPVKLHTGSLKDLFHQLNPTVSNDHSLHEDYDINNHLREDQVLAKCNGENCVLAIKVKNNSPIGKYVDALSDPDVRQKAKCLINPKNCKKPVEKCKCLKKPINCKKKEASKSKCAEAKKKLEECKKKCKGQNTDNTNTVDETTRNPDPYYPDFDPTRSYENYGDFEPYRARVLRMRSKRNRGKYGTHKTGKKVSKRYKKSKRGRKGTQRKFSLDYVELSDLTWRAKNRTAPAEDTAYNILTGGNINANYSLRSGLSKALRSVDETPKPQRVEIKPSTILQKIISSRNDIKNHSLQLVRTKNVTINYGEEPKIVRSMNINMQSKNVASDSPDALDAFLKDLRSKADSKEDNEVTTNDSKDTKVVNYNTNDNNNPDSLVSKIIHHILPGQEANDNLRRALKKWTRENDHRHERAKKSEESDDSSESSEKIEKSSEKIEKSSEKREKSVEKREKSVERKSKRKSSESDDEEKEKSEEEVQIYREKTHKPKEEEEDEVEAAREKKHKPKRFQVIDSMINKFVEKELFKFNENSGESNQASDPLTEEETTTTKRPKPKKKFKGKPMDIIQGPGRVYSEGNDFRRNRLPYFLPKRYDWDPQEYHKLGYFWFNGPQGRNPGPWRIYAK